MGFAIALSGCAAPSETTTFAASFVTPGVTLASAQGCATLQVKYGLAVCKDDVALVQSAGAREVPALDIERPQEIVGHEAHHAVLDGAS
ncbi:MAG: hypothetical protein H7Y60_08225 [Rhodospirillaceae bacterium]|nr:hypothetical protein [Rhodospirillales bacterium]